MDLGRAIVQRRLHVDHGGQLVDIHLDRFGRRSGLRRTLSDNGGNRIAHMAHLALGQDWMGRLLHRLPMFVGHLPAAGHSADAFEIGTGEDADHARHILGHGGVDLVDLSMGQIRAQEMHIGLTMKIDVIGIAPLPGQKPHILAPFGTCAYATVFRHGRPPLCCLPPAPPP